MTEAFTNYLNLINHPKAEQVKKYKTRVVKIKWRNTTNKMDCGIYCIRHMESYACTLKDWDCGLKKDDVLVLKLLRAHYCHDILMWDANLLKEEVKVKAIAFFSTTEQEIFPSRVVVVNSS